MPRYSAERKAAVLAKLLPPLNRSIPSVAAEERISEATLYNWRQHARKEGYPVPGSGKQFDDWPVDAKLATIIETAALSASELSAYCRSKGLYPDQVVIPPLLTDVVSRGVMPHSVSGLAVCHR
jgi:transposase